MINVPYRRGRGRAGTRILRLMEPRPLAVRRTVMNLRRPLVSLLATGTLAMTGGCAAQGEPALWWPAAGRAIGPDTQVLEVMVLERECASGQRATGRIKEPKVERDERQVIVTFTVEPVGEATCPSNPPTPHRLDLGEPLGQRQLLDGGTEPPRAPIPAD